VSAHLCGGVLGGLLIQHAGQYFNAAHGSAGGHPMNNVQKSRCLFVSLGICLFWVSSLVAQDSIVRIIQTNFAGSNAHVIDPTTNKVVDIIQNVPKAHAAVNHPDGTYFYFANEHDHNIVVVDTKTLEVVDRIPLVERPNKLVINKTQNKLYVAIRDSAHLQIIDLDSHKVIKTLSVHAGIHNVYVTKDDNYIVAGLGAYPETFDEPTIQVIDASTDEIAFSISLEGFRVRPMAIESNSDGSPSRIFAQAERLNGFYVVDWDQRKAIDFVAVPSLSMAQQNFDGIQNGTGHGLLVLPDQSALWYASRLDSRVYAWSLPDLEFMGGIEVGPSPQWLTATPDSQTLYVSMVGSMETVALDTQAHEIIARIPVGFGPKRNSTHILPAALAR
jgi:YVTN family beta-propeller protein